MKKILLTIILLISNCLHLSTSNAKPHALVIFKGSNFTIIQENGSLYKIKNGNRIGLVGILFKYVAIPSLKYLVNTVKESAIEWAKEKAIRVVSGGENRSDIEGITIKIGENGITSYTEDHDHDGSLDNPSLDEYDDKSHTNEEELSEDVEGSLEEQLKYIDPYYDGDLDGDGNDGENEEDDDNDSDAEREEDDDNNNNK